MSHQRPCPRICIDDLCRGNYDNTLCGGCYCMGCGTMTVEPRDCDDCNGYDEADDWDGEE